MKIFTRLHFAGFCDVAISARPLLSDDTRKRKEAGDWKLRRSFTYGRAIWQEVFYSGEIWRALAHLGGHWRATAIRGFQETEHFRECTFTYNLYWKCINYKRYLWYIYNIYKLYFIRNSPEESAPALIPKPKRAVANQSYPFLSSG